MDKEAGTLIVNFYLLSLATRSYCAKRRPALNFALKLARENRLVSHFHSVPTTSHTLPIVTASLQSSLDDYKATKLILKIVNNQHCFLKLPSYHVVGCYPSEGSPGG